MIILFITPQQTENYFMISTEVVMQASNQPPVHEKVESVVTLC